MDVDKELHEGGSVLSPVFPLSPVEKTDVVLEE